MVYEGERIKTDILYTHLLMHTGCSLENLTYTFVAHTGMSGHYITYGLAVTYL